MKCNQSRPGFELVSPYSFPPAITTTPRAPPTVKEWYNPSGTSDGRGDLLEQNWPHKNKMNSPPTINTHLLFDVQTAYSSTRQKERGGVESVVVYEQTERNTPPPRQLKRILWMQNPNWQLTDWLTDHFFKIRYFLYIEIQDIGGGDVILLNYCVISHVSKIHCFYFSNQTCHRQDMNPFCLHFGLPLLNVVYSLKLSNLTYVSAQRF